MYCRFRLIIGGQFSFGYGNYYIFKDKEDCNLYLQNKNREKIISNINGIKRRIFELKNKLKKLEC